KPKSLSSAIKGSAIGECSCQSLGGCSISQRCRPGRGARSALAREDTEQRNDVGNRQIGLAIVVREGSAGGGHRLRRKGDRSRGTVIDRVAGGRAGQHRRWTGWRGGPGGVARAERVRMAGHLRGGQGD